MLLNGRLELFLGDFQILNTPTNDQMFMLVNKWGRGGGQKSPKSCELCTATIFLKFDPKKFL